MRTFVGVASPLVVPAALVIGAVMWTWIFDSQIYDRIVLRMLISLILVVGLYVFTGNSGVVSFGHAGFMAIGAYIGALLTIPVAQKSFLLPDLPTLLANTEMSIVPAMFIAGAITCGIALVIGPPIMRLSGMAAGIATFALLMIIRVVIRNWDSVTRGTSSMPGVPIDVTIEKALLAALSVMVLAYAFQVSRVGRRLQASREDHVAAQSIGINVVRDRTLAFGLSAFIVAVGGVSFGHFVGIFSPDDFFLSTTFVMVAMLVVGGIYSLAGAVVGTLAVSTVSEGLIRLEVGVSIGDLDISAPSGLREAGLGAFLLAILIFRPEGITAGREFVWPPRFIRGQPSTDADVTAQERDGLASVRSESTTSPAKAGPPVRRVVEK